MAVFLDVSLNIAHVSEKTPLVCSITGESDPKTYLLRTSKIELERVGFKGHTTVQYCSSIRKIRAFRGSGRTSRVGSGRVGLPDPTQPAKKLRCLHLTRPDPRDFQNFLTRPVRLRTPLDPTRPAAFRLTRETRVSCRSRRLAP